MAVPSDVQRSLDRFAAGYRDVGIVAGVVDHGRVSVYTAGTLGPGGPPLNEWTEFQIGSITKTLTATLLAQMALQHRVSLDDPIARYLPVGVTAPSYRGKPITLEELAEQNSGLPRLPTNLEVAEDASDPYATYTPAMLDDFLEHYRLTRAPGSRYEYSNLGVGLLGDLLANRASEAFGTLLRLEVLAPLRMRWTGISPERYMIARLAPGHTIDGTPQQPWTFGELQAAGAAYSNVHDMLRYLQANLAAPNGPLGRAMQLAQTPRAEGGFGGYMRIGLVWESNEYAGITWHDGETGGYQCFIGFNVGQDSGVVLLANVADPDVDRLAIHIMAPDRVPAPVPSASRWQGKLPTR